MSFFLEATRNTQFPTNQFPSPFDYTINEQKKQLHNYAPFNSTSKLNRTAIKSNKKQQLFKQNEEQALIKDKINTQQHVMRNMNSIFKSGSQRIIYQYNDIPGPGSYEIGKKERRKIKIEKTNYTVYQKQDKKPANFILSTDVQGKKIADQKKFLRTSSSLRQTSKQLPSSNQMIQSSNKSSKTIHIINIKQKEYNGPGPGTYNITIAEQNKGASACFNSSSIRFNSHKLKTLYSPGPGSYDINSQPLIRAYSQSHFNSKSTRFPINKTINCKIGPGSYIKDKKQEVRNAYNKIVQKIQPIRKTIFNNYSNCNLGPGEYIYDDGMTFQLHKYLLKNPNLSQVSHCNRQLFTIKNQQQPGPGTYNPTQPNIPAKGNVRYRNAQASNIKAQQDLPNIQVPFQCVLENNATQHQSQKLIKKPMSQKKTFNQGVLRRRCTAHQKLNYNGYATSTKLTDSNALPSQKYQSPIISLQGTKKLKKLIMTSVKVKIPFGSSVSKQKTKQVSEIGPGSYNQNINWIKATFNIKGKIFYKC